MMILGSPHRGMTSTAALRVGAALLLLALVSACYPTPGYQVSRQRVTRATHDALFPINSGSHAGVDCNVCHGDYSTFGHFSCIVCHEHDQPSTDPAHTGVVGYAYGPETCYGCHANGGTFSRAQHDTYFPIETGAHAQVACSECHVSGFATFECIQCHDHQCSTMDPAHQGVTSYACASPSCLNCHPRGEAMSRAAHASFFPIEVGNHAAIGCRDCHVVDFASFDCIDCHSHTCAMIASNHGEVGNFVCDSPTCRSCHPTGAVGG